MTASPQSSRIDLLRQRGPGVVERFLRSLSDRETYLLPYDWVLNARPKQAEPPGDWFTWLIKAGRGFGKTRTGAEFIRDNVENHGYRRPAFVGRDAEDVRKTMIEGISGIQAVYPEQQKPEYAPSIKQIVFPNGAIGDVFYGTEPEKARGPEHDIIWIDELCAMAYPQQLLDNLIFGLRRGPRPKMLITSTPKPVKVIKELLKRAGQDVHVTNGTTWENRTNLSRPFISHIEERYEGTRLGRQEIYGDILDDNPNALWRREWIDRDRLPEAPEELERIVVAVDPGASTGEDAAETGIVVAGVKGREYYVLADVSLKGRPAEWGLQAVAAYKTFDADRIIAERNNGGDMVESTIRNVDNRAAVKTVWASRGKVTRAEPVSALYERRKVHHVGTFPELEEQLCEWEPGDDSPDRLDALVWALSELMTQGEIKSLYERLREEGYSTRVEW